MRFVLKRFSAVLILAFLLASTTGCVSSVAPRRAHPVPEPKIVRQSFELAPSVKGSITKVQFFESGRSDTDLRKTRIYQTRFPRATTKTVYTEIHFEHPQARSRMDFPVSLVVRRSDGTIYRIEDYTARIKEGWTSSDHWIGVGYHRPDKWRVDIYQVEIQVNGDKVATSYFEIY